MQRAALLVLLAGCPGKHSETPAPAVAPDAGAEPVVDEDALEAERTAAIEHAMNELAPVASQCWAAAAVDDYQLAGDVKILVEVGVGVTVEEDTTRDPVLTDCLRAVLEGYTWPEVMDAQSFLLPFEFSAPHGQNVIDRAYVPATAGARVLLDMKNSGNAAASMFELVVEQQPAATASERTEVWVNTATLDATFYPPKASRAPAPGTYVIVSVPGGAEDATRTSGVLPAGPPSKKPPKAIAAPRASGFSKPREGVGTVTILVEQATAKSDAVAASILEIDGAAVIPAHVHDTSTEMLYVLSGSGEMIIDGVTLPVTPTTVVQIPKGVEHSFTAHEPLTVLQFYAPAGPEQRFKK